uniref:NADH-ubiquinone oxidoreductase chain 4 n=1 Tax=Hariotina sp. MMOGRB0030F TaxID=1867922 RepID=A0A1D6Z2D1_9CHLO|nr:NADH dehydrogenase subunit 4 [Hariotina sp. MMOGRB0030F]
MWPLVISLCIIGTVLVLCLPTKRLLAIVLLLPLRGSLFLCVLPGKDSKKHSVFRLFVTMLTLVLCIRLWSSFVPTRVEPFQQVVGVSRNWNGLLTVKLEFGLDSLSLWMVLLTARLMPLTVLCSWNTQNKHSQSFYRLLLALESFLFRTFTRLDLFCFYVLYECALLPMFLLIGLGGSRARKVRAAYLLVLYTLVGSLAMLPCLLLLYSRAGTTSYLLLNTLNIESSRQLLLWWGFFLAFAVKVPLMPLHLWLPEAHVERSTAGSVLLAGVLLKLGTYGLLRFNLYLFPQRSTYLRPMVSTICLIGVIYASLTTLRQVDLKKLVAYSSIAHMSMVVLALFTMNEVGILGSIFTMLAHGVRSPALFLCVGALYDRTHTKALKYLGGAATAMPLFSIWFFIFSLCNMALPLTPNFIGEFLSLCGIFANNFVSLIICLGGVILSAVYTLWAYARVVHGMPKIQNLNGMADLNRREWCTLAVLAIIAIWWGLKPTAVTESLGSCVYFWQQCCLVVLEPAPWALLF